MRRALLTLALTAVAVGASRGAGERDRRRRSRTATAAGSTNLADVARETDQRRKRTSRCTVDRQARPRAQYIDRAACSTTTGTARTTRRQTKLYRPSATSTGNHEYRAASRTRVRDPHVEHRHGLRPPFERPRARITATSARVAEIADDTSHRLSNQRQASSRGRLHGARGFAVHLGRSQTATSSRPGQSRRGSTTPATTPTRQRQHPTFNGSVYRLRRLSDGSTTGTTLRTPTTVTTQPRR